MSDAAVEARGIGVCYRLPKDRIASFKEYMLRRLFRKMEYHEFWALKDLNLGLRRGEVVGVIGENGAGKSTFLKVLSRILRPTEGRVLVRGRVAPLLALGAGFHADMTGRENIVINAALLGYSARRTREKAGRVVEFAELEQFIDAPVRTYSSGMLARLGFSVATMFRPDVLLVDEVLAVGDVRFQEKCLTRIREFRAQGTTIVLVSHSLGVVEENCDRAVWINHGRLEADGEPADILPRYGEFLKQISR